MGNRFVAPLLPRWGIIALGWLIPRFSLRQLPAMLAIAALGALAASIYGVLHDQVTYTISPEYFTKLKFEQFAWADLGLPPRVLVAQIGVLASWAVGLAGGWFVARAAAWESLREVRGLLVARAFGIVAIVTLASALIGWALGRAAVTLTDLAPWHVFRDSLRLHDLPSFVVVAYIHNATYLGAAIGIIAAVWVVLRARRLGLHVR
jgi:hypothetical protein